MTHSPYLTHAPTQRRGSIHGWERTYNRPSAPPDTLCDCHRRTITGPYAIVARHDAAGRLTVTRECRV